MLNIGVLISGGGTNLQAIIDERELHKSFNMGIGLVMVVEKDKAEEVVNFINNREEEIHVDTKYTELMKDRAYIIGEVVDTHEGVNLC